jgi:hypothetical protein
VSPEEMLARVAATYANTLEYADTCELEMRDVRGEFRTSFNRSKLQLLFDGTEIAEGHEHRFVLDATLPIGDAVASLAGVTFAVAHTIPRLLLPGVVGGRSILDAPATLLRQTDEQIEVILTSNVPRRIVIDARTWLIVVHEHDLSDRTTIVARYKLVL